MMMPDVEERHALAELNPYHSVEQCFEVWVLKMLNKSLLLY